MGTRHSRMRSKVRLENVAKRMQLKMNEARAKQITLRWYDNVLYYTIKGEKESVVDHYDEITADELIRIIDILCKMRIVVTGREESELRSQKISLKMKDESLL